MLCIELRNLTNFSLEPSRDEKALPFWNFLNEKSLLLKVFKALVEAKIEQWCKEKQVQNFPMFFFSQILRRSSVFQSACFAWSVIPSKISSFLCLFSLLFPHYQQVEVLQISKSASRLKTLSFSENMLISCLGIDVNLVSSKVSNQC